MLNNKEKSLKTIYFLNPQNIPPITGGERYDYEIAKYLKRKNFKVFFINEKVVPLFIRYAISTPLFLIFHLFLTPNEVVIVQGAHHHKRYLLSNTFFKLFTNIKILTIMHHPTFPFKKNKLIRFVEYISQKYQLMLSDRIITNSNYTKSQITDINISPEKIIIINPAVDYPNKTFKERPLSSPPILFYLGYITPRKGLIYILEALSNLKDYDWHFIVAGEDAYYPRYIEACNKIIEDAGIEDRVEFLGHIDRPEINEIFLKTDIFILPSRHESYGMVIKEAASYGIPIITTNVGAIPEIATDEENALLIPPIDSEAIENAIVRILTNEDLRKKLARGAFDSVDFSYDWATVGGKAMEVILDLH